jgi:lactoylglutathione lyase
MIHAQDLFEVHMTVADLDRSIAFYRDAVGLQLAHITSGRQAAFFWIGAAGNAMLGLWTAGSGPQKVTVHTAFRASLADVVSAPRALRSAGVTPLDFDGRPTDQPVVLAWMPAVSVFFRDPDGHLLEYIAMLPHEPRPEYGIVPWRMWELMSSATSMADALQTR